tara:strand:- start:21 stop:632 length:612 start_codon:yes stop_codon:yes gene_type:complete
MTKKSTKKVKEALKKIPKVKASPGFRERLYERIRNEHDPDFMLDDRPECDQVDFDGGNVTIARGDDWRLDVTPAGWSIWIGILWVILSMPLWLGVYHAFKPDNVIDNGDTYLVPSSNDINIDLEPVVPIELDMIDPMPVDDLLQDDTGYIEDLEDGQFIWEAQVDFSKAFKLARMYLGPNDVFTWRGNDYTTMYIEEVVLFNN